MSDGLGSEGNPLKVLIVGSGPSGFYAADALLKADVTVEIDILDRLATPFGLVRAGVAPDHAKIKAATKAYDKIADNPNVSFLGNVTFGRDVALAEIQGTHHAVIFTCGAESDRRLGIPGEDLPGSHTATEFVYWYNGHPDYRDHEFDLSQEVAVIIGQGNVAADVCRILAKTVDELKNTDIAEHALEALSQSKIRDIHMIGRRGPAQAKFTHAELKEFGELADCDPVIDPAILDLNAASKAELEDKTNRSAIKNIETLTAFSQRPAGSKSRNLHFRFLEGPTELKGGSRLEAVTLMKNQLEGEAFNQWAEETGETIDLPCGLLFRSIGYRGIPIADVPFDDKKGVFPNQEGRITNDGSVLPGVYCAGWIKRGPSGIIGTNRPDSVETVGSLLADLSTLEASEKTGGAGLRSLLEGKGVRVVSYEDWQKIDAAEVANGEAKGKPREKFTRIEDMLAVLS